MSPPLPSVARVIVASPLPQLDRELEYLVPEQLRALVGVGMRVTVPLRSSKRQLQGFIVGLAEEAEFGGKLAPLSELVSEARVLTPEIAGLARAVADRQAGCAADILRLAIPQRSVRVEQQWLEREGGGSGTDTAAASATAGCEVDAHEPDAVLAARYSTEHAEALSAGPAFKAALDVPLGVDGGVPSSLRVLAAIAAARLARGQSVILAVPDYRDVDLALTALERHVPAASVRRLDTRAKPAARYAAFLECLGDAPGIVVGTRSAIYSPASHLGAILIWDDGDESFTEQLAPYAHTRDVALLRQQREAVALVFASHTPSLEVARLASLGYVETVGLQRPQAPSIIAGDQTLAEESHAAAARIPTLAWQEAKRALERGPVLMQVVRSGYIPSLRCSRCREPARCTRCGGALQFTSAGAPPSCRVCDALHPEWQCAECGERRLRNASLGADRTGEELGRAFPGTPVIVADGASETISIDDAPRLVVATRGAEPVPTGGYAAIVLLDTERSLAQERLDASIDALRGWSNAAALVAPGARVIIAGADAPALQALRAWQQPGYAASELEERRQLSFPPAVRLVAITGTDAEVAQTLRALESLEQFEQLMVLGPTPQEDGARAIVKFAYALGPALAKALKVQLVKAATSRRPRVAGRPGGHPSMLRVRFDPPGVF